MSSELGSKGSLYMNEPLNPNAIKSSLAQGFIVALNPNDPLNPSMREELLTIYLKKQQFRVSIGKSKWLPYMHFDERYNLREILRDEIVIEFDSTDLEIVCRAIGETGLNLLRAGYTFEYWEHGGKSPHLHIHNLPISHFDDSKLALFKKIFIRKYVPIEYLPYVDLSLTNVHLIALEWANHWKGCYGVKKLLYVAHPEDLIKAEGGTP